MGILGCHWGRRTIRHGSDMDRNDSGTNERTDGMTTEQLHEDWCCYITGGCHGEGGGCCCGAAH